MTIDDYRPLSVAGKARLAAEVASTYLRARRAVRTDDLPTALAKLRARVGAGDGVSYPQALQLGRAVGRTLTVLPADDRCLMRSLVLTAMLARRGAKGTLVIGVRPGEDFGAHAWVELDGKPLLYTGSGEYPRLVEL